jgi:hypothetical protein
MSFLWSSLIHQQRIDACFAARLFDLVRPDTSQVLHGLFRYRFSHDPWLPARAVNARLYFHVSRRLPYRNRNV